METKTIALDREAYELLRRNKAAGESFSDVVKRLAGKRRPLAEFAGIWKRVSTRDLRQIEAALAKGRELDRERALRVLKGLG